MKFVAIPGIKPLVSIYELRLEDYRSFAVETKRPWTPTEFIQGEGHPAVNMSWNDVQAFATWLTGHERAAGKLGATQRYRLLTDEEWSHAVGLPVELGATPEEKDTKLKGIYPWGTISPPPSDTENLAGQGETSLPDNELRDYHDGFSHTAPVGRFKVNPFGLYDMGGNVAEWVEDWYDAGRTERTIRGSAYIYISRFDVNSSFRWHLKPDDLADYIGTRLAIDLGPAAHSEPRASEPQPR
jgi:formylglycine-generating enzyme required for sulfatase activity